MNRVCLVGRTTKDIETRQAGQTTVARFTLAVDRRGKDDGADFISVTAFGKAAELLQKYVHKGDRIGVVGRIRTGSYEKDGEKRYTTEVVLDELEFLTPKGQTTQQDDYVPMPDEIDDDDLPF